MKIYHLITIWYYQKNCQNFYPRWSCCWRRGHRSGAGGGQGSPTPRTPAAAPIWGSPMHARQRLAEAAPAPGRGWPAWPGPRPRRFRDRAARASLGLRLCFVAWPRSCPSAARPGAMPGTMPHGRVIPVHMLGLRRAVGFGGKHGRERTRSHHMPTAHTISGPRSAGFWPTMSTKFCPLNKIGSSLSRS